MYIMYRSSLTTLYIDCKKIFNVIIKSQLKDGIII